MTRIRLGIVVTHPIQYHAPLYRLLAQSHVVDLEVLFLTTHGVEPTYDPGFNRAIAFDVPLLEGYRHRFVENRARVQNLAHPLGVVNPGLVVELSPSRYDAVLVHGYGHISEWISYLTAAVLRLPYLVRGESRLTTAAPLRGHRRFVKSVVVGTMVRRAAACLSIGSKNRGFYLAYGVDPNRIIDAPYSIDNVRFAEAGDRGRRTRADRLTELGLDPDLPILLFAAKLEARKRPFDLLEAFGDLRMPCNLVYVGDGELCDALMRRTQGMDRVRGIGFVNQQEIGEWYGVADVFVLPSDYEPWGLSVNEAMAAGCIPVVSDAVGCAADLVTRESGRVFPVGDVAALCSVLDELASSPSLRRVLADGARERIKAFDVVATARGIEQGAATAVEQARG